MRGSKSQEFSDSFPIAGIFDGPFLEYPSKLSPKRRVLVYVVLRQIIQKPKNSPHRRSANSLDVLRLLQDFSREVKRQVVGVNYATNKAQICRQHLGRIIHDENTSDIQFDTVTIVA